MALRAARARAREGVGPKTRRPSAARLRGRPRDEGSSVECEGSTAEGASDVDSEGEEDSRSGSRSSGVEGPKCFRMAA